MKIVLAYNLNRNNQEFEADFDTQDIIDNLELSIKNKFNNVDLLLVECNLNICVWIKKIEEFNPDIIFNVTEGYKGNGREAFAPIIFEQIGYKYTGPKVKELVICQDKNLVKKILNYNNISTPKGILVKDYFDLKNKIENLNFPLFVKLNSEGSSLGIDDESICYNIDDLIKKVKKINEKYGKDIIIEEYIEGEDLSITYIEGLGFFGPLKYIYPNNKKVYDYNLKIYDYEGIDLVRINLEKTILIKIMDDCKKIIDILGINRYCRIELRFNKNNGKHYFIEVNGQVCFLKNGSFIEAVDNKSFEEILSHIITLDL